ncbi:unnamed protein product [Sphagnum balticum]
MGDSIAGVVMANRFCTIVDGVKAVIDSVGESTVLPAGEPCAEPGVVHRCLMLVQVAVDPAHIKTLIVILEHEIGAETPVDEGFNQFDFHVYARSEEQHKGEDQGQTETNLKDMPDTRQLTEYQHGEEHDERIDNTLSNRCIMKLGSYDADQKPLEKHEQQGTDKGYGQPAYLFFVLDIHNDHHRIEVHASKSYRDNPSRRSSSNAYVSLERRIEPITLRSASLATFSEN